MLRRTIANFFGFVILWSSLSLVLTACHNAGTVPRETDRPSGFSPPRISGRIVSREIDESSGIAASKCQDGVLWTHNDSGDDAHIYALNESGESLGTWRVPAVPNQDWEDIAVVKGSDGTCTIYIGEIGDNELIHAERAVYTVREPIVDDESRKSARKNALATEKAGILRFTYPDGRHDAETLMVHPVTMEIYVITKKVSGSAGVYRLTQDRSQSGAQRAVKVANISVPAVPNGLLTGGDISPDGRSVVLCDYRQAYELTLPATTSDFAEIWTQKPMPVDLGKRKGGEGVGYTADGRGIYASSEGRNSPLIIVRRQ